MTDIDPTRTCSTCIHRYVCHFLHVARIVNQEVMNDPPGKTQFLPYSGMIGLTCNYYRKEK